MHTAMMARMRWCTLSRPQVLVSVQFEIWALVSFKSWIAIPATSSSVFRGACEFTYGADWRDENETNIGKYSISIRQPAVFHSQEFTPSCSIQVK